MAAHEDNTFMKDLNFCRIGRLKVILVCSVTMVISGVAASFSVDIYMLAALTFILGAAVAGARNSGFVYSKHMLMEIFYRWSASS